MPSPSRRHDPEVLAISEQFRVLILKANDLVDGINDTVLLLDKYLETHQEKEVNGS